MQVISQGKRERGREGKKKKKRHFPQVSAWFSREKLRSWGCTCQNIECLQLFMKMPVVVLNIEAVIYYKLLWEIRAWVSQIAHWKLPYFDRKVPGFSFLICKLRIIVLSLFVGDGVCLPVFGTSHAVVMCSTKVQEGIDFLSSTELK